MAQIKKYINDIPEMLEKKRVAEGKNQNQAIIKNNCQPIQFSAERTLDAGTDR